MTAWTGLITLGLQIALALLQFANNRKLLDAGRDREVAAAALRVLDNTHAGKILRDKIKQLDDDESKALWKDITRA